MLSTTNDEDAGVAYVRLAPGDIFRTVQVTDSVLLDVHENLTPLGVEFLSPRLGFPWQELGEYLPENTLVAVSKQVEDFLRP